MRKGIFGMKRRNLIVLLIIIVFGVLVYSTSIITPLKRNMINNSQLTLKEKLDDFEYMYAILKDNYPYFEVNKRQTGIDWLSKRNDYISKIKSTSDDDSFFNALQNILSDLCCGHTNMLDKNFYSYALSAYEKDNKHNKAWVTQLTNSKTVARYSKMKDTEKTFPTSCNNFISNNVKTSLLENDKVAYLSISTFNTFNIAEDMKIIRPFLNDIKNYKTLIIDIRGNGGGDSTYWSHNIVPLLINKPLSETQYELYRGGNFIEPFIQCREGLDYANLEPISNIKKYNLKNSPPELQKDFKYYIKHTTTYEPINPIGFEGKIYLIIDNKVFSSSEGFATFAKSTGFATLVGETTSGDGIGSDPAICVLPNSGYAFRFTKEMGLTSDGTCNFEHKTEPHIKVSSTKNSDPSKDEAIKTVMKLID